jgi:hypothetical protein
MPKEQFGVKQAGKITSETDKGKIKKLIFRANQNDGLIVTFSVKGPSEVVDKRFMGFPMGTGIDTLVSLDTSQQTLAGTLAKQAQADKIANQSKGKNETLPEMLNHDDEDEDDDEDVMKELDDAINDLSTPEPSTKPKIKTKV